MQKVHSFVLKRNLWGIVEETNGFIALRLQLDDALLCRSRIWTPQSTRPSHDFFKNIQHHFETPFWNAIRYSQIYRFSSGFFKLCHISLPQNSLGFSKASMSLRFGQVQPAVGFCEAFLTEMCEAKARERSKAGKPTLLFSVEEFSSNLCPRHLHSQQPLHILALVRPGKRVT